MTAVLSTGAHCFQPPGYQLPMTDNGADDAWRFQYIQQMPLTAGHWQDGSDQVSSMTNGMLERNLHTFQSEAGSYTNAFSGDQLRHHQQTAAQFVSPRLAFVPDNQWGSDMEMGTPSTAGFPTNIDDSYHHMRHPSNNTHSHLPLLPSHHERVDAAIHSPHSSFSGLSPSSQNLNIEPPSDRKVIFHRPGISRSITAPEPISQRQHYNSNPPSPPLKRSNSEDEDDDFLPSSTTDPKSSRAGRKRQRIPHTAVERRYRENLNAHLDKLRQNVPALNARRGPGGVAAAGGKEGEGVKPSKCEVLNGAIEHITTLGKENGALKMENQALRERLADLERWFAHK